MAVFHPSLQFDNIPLGKGWLDDLLSSKYIAEHVKMHSMPSENDDERNIPRVAET